MTQAHTTKSIYTRQGLWYLFVMCAFPLHLWTILLALQDVGWVSERTNSWDAVGVASYGLLFALIESVLVFLVFSVIGFILPRSWSAKKRTGFLILLITILSIWGIVGQLLFLWNMNLPWPIIHFLAGTEHPLRWLYALTLFIVLSTVIFPVFFFTKEEKTASWIYNLADQLSLLTGLYLLLDAMGIVIVITRNL